MERQQVIDELKALLRGFMEVNDAVPVCLEEAIRLLSKEKGEKESEAKD